jgi:hypothetical protein
MSSLKGQSFKPLLAQREHFATQPLTVNNPLTVGF